MFSVHRSQISKSHILCSHLILFLSLLFKWCSNSIKCSSNETIHTMFNVHEYHFLLLDPECAIFKLLCYMCLLLAPCSVSLYEMFTVPQIDISRSANGNSAKVKPAGYWISDWHLTIAKVRIIEQFSPRCELLLSLSSECWSNLFHSYFINFFSSFWLPTVWNRPALVTYKLWLYTICIWCPIHSIIVLRMLIATTLHTEFRTKLLLWQTSSFYELMQLIIKSVRAENVYFYLKTFSH